MATQPNAHEQSAAKTPVSHGSRNVRSHSIPAARGAAGALSLPIPHAPSPAAARGKPLQYAAKRWIDYAAALTLLIGLSPLLVALAVVVKMSSRGPVLYVGQRLGRDRQAFPCFKFRTMCAGAEAMQPEVEHMNQAAGPLFKITRDPRITRVGHFMRITCLDEWPQLVNVLRGEMSLVGPRPLPLRDCELLPEAADCRYDVLPGITGTWQVMPDHHGPEVDIVQLDRDYVNGWSLALDARVLAKTARLLVRAARTV